jgi:1-acyl-sn-glycerol-3-phosphate acyltransferase
VAGERTPTGLRVLKKTPPDRDPKQRERRWVVNAMRVILWVWFKLVHGVRWRHAERVPRAGPIILAPTHASFYDPFIVSIPVRRRFSYFTRASYFFFPLGPIIHYLSAFPADLEKRFDRKAYEQAKRILEGNGALVLFPEGTRTLDGELGPIHGGVAMLALDAGATIIPVSVCGTFEAWPRTRQLFRLWRPIVITYHHPLVVEKTDDPPLRRARTREINAYLDQTLRPRLAAFRRWRERRERPLARAGAPK